VKALDHKKFRKISTILLRREHKRKAERLATKVRQVILEIKPVAAALS